MSPVAFYSVSYGRTTWALTWSLDKLKDRNANDFEAYMVRKREMSSYIFSWFELSMSLKWWTNLSFIHRGVWPTFTVFLTFSLPLPVI